MPQADEGADPARRQALLRGRLPALALGRRRELVSIVPGEKLHIEVEIGKDGRLERLRAVPEVTAPDRTVTLFFKSDSTLKLLEVKNPFGRPLRFELAMQLAGRDGVYDTSSVPAIPRGSAIEMWHDPIVQLLVGRFRLLDEPAAQ